MGLSGPKNRTKLSKDPNNTTWSTNTTRFGHRILSSQGWTPGSTLGAVDAAHAAHYTAASSAHIRVLLKEDNLGLGARVGSAERFGLDSFANILGRLNGRSEGELAREEGERRDRELRVYQTRRFGNMVFVSGGFLVGDKIERIGREVVEAEAGVSLEGAPVGVGKRKRGNGEIRVDGEGEGGKDAEKRKKRKEKTGKKKEKGKPDQEVQAATSEPQDNAKDDVLTDAVESKEQRRKRRAEKKARKEARRLRREAKHQKRAAAKQPSSSSSSESDDPGHSTKTSTPAISVSATPSGTSTPTVFSGRNVVRQRYIQQKRMACMDAKALAEIFMVKAQT